MRQRHAFTLVELLVTIAIVAVLIGLILPAVQRIKEAANRARCANSLRQYGLACHSYESTAGRFPCGGGTAHGSRGKWQQDISPWMEKHAEGWARVRFDCPSKVVLFVSPSYAAADFDQRGLIDTGEKGIPAYGITDGLSNTAMISELWIDNVNRALSTFVKADNRWTSNAMRSTLFPPSLDGKPGSVFGFGSNHAALPVVWGDGSVRSVAYDVDAAVWKAAGTRAGGECH